MKQKKKLDKINIQFLKDLSKIEEGLKEIKEFEMMFLGGAWSEVSPFVKKLVDYGSKLTLLDACDEFKIKSQDNVRLISEVISNKKGKATFYETTPKDCSSLFELNEEVFSRYKFLQHVKTNKEYEVNVTTLKDLGNFRPNYRCMDLQGGEILALEGTQETFFDNLYLITTETCFVSLYKQQPLFSDYLEFFNSKDYKLIDLGEIRKAHNIDLNLKTNLGIDSLYTDLTFIKKQINHKDVIKAILGLLVEYRYSECYRIYESYKKELDAEVRLCLIKFFNKLKKAKIK